MKRWKKALIVLCSVLVIALAALFVRYASLGIDVSIDQAKLPPTPATPVATEFSIVAYNVQARPVFDDSVFKFTRMPPVLNPYDIVAIQEMWKDHERMFAGWTFPVKIYNGTLNSPFKVTGTGLGIAARFPLVETVGMNYSTAGDFQNMPASKGALLARLNVGGLPVDVYTTHMAAGHKSDSSTVSRQTQGWELAEFVRTHSTPESAVILLGDFNMRHSKPGKEDSNTAAGHPPANFTGLSQTQVLDAMVVYLGLKDIDKETKGEYLDAVDHILFRSGTKAVLTPLAYEHDTPAFYDDQKKPLSDHSPLIGHFRISPPGTK